MGGILTYSFECSKWSKWVLNGPSGSSNGPRQSQRVPDNHSSFRKVPKFYHFPINYLLAPPGALGGVALQNFLIISPLSSNPIRHLALSVPNGPSGFSMVPMYPQMVPDSPRESQAVPDSSKFQKSFQFWPFFRMEMDYLLAPPGALGGVAFQNFLIISPLSSKSHPSRHLAFSVPNGPSGFSMVPMDPQMVPDTPRESETHSSFRKVSKFDHFLGQRSTIY